MPDRLPPLTALRAFEAAARLLSFAKAAEELHVTPAALSHQIKSLEAHLGMPLFRRLNRAVELTEAGRALSPGATDGFAVLMSAWRNAKRLTVSNVLNVTAGPAFTAKWMAPRLYEFARAHPEIELKFSASLKMMDFQRDEIDVAIRFGRGGDTGLYALPLAKEWVCPVMSPQLAEQYPTLESLKDAPLIHDASIDFLDPQPNWAAWFKMMNIGTPPPFALTFSQADHAVDAAVAGVGITLGRRALVVKEISDGRLVLPFKTALHTGARFRFICPEGAQTRPQIQTFRDWIIAEIEKTAWITETLDIRPLEA
ncbi:MAG: transcriptional regulator GcvA [Pseudomonadota bacterium]